MTLKLIKRSTPADFIEEQNKKFGLKVSTKDIPSSYEEFNNNQYIFAREYKHEEARNKCRGIIFLGKTDGPVIIVFNPYDFQPMSMILNGTWKPVKGAKPENNPLSPKVRDNPKNARNRENRIYKKDHWIMFATTDVKLINLSKITTTSKKVS